ARRAVKIATLRHRIEMGANDDAWSATITSGHRHVGIGSRVVLDEQIKSSCSRRNKAMSEILPFTVGVAEYAFSFGCFFAQFIEQRDCHGFLMENGIHHGFNGLRFPCSIGSMPRRLIHRHTPRLWASMTHGAASSPWTSSSAAIDRIRSVPKSN